MSVARRRDLVGRVWPPPSVSTSRSEPSGRRSSWSTPGRPIGHLPVFSDLVSLQYVRTEGTASILVGDSDHSAPEWSDPDDYRERAATRSWLQMIPKFDRPLSRPEWARLSSSYAGCYDVTPDYNPMISGLPGRRVWLCAGFSGHGYKISPSVGELMADLITAGDSRHPDIDHHDFRLGALRRPTTSWSAPTPMPARARCAERRPPLPGRRGSGAYH